ncbi:MFS transporter [Sulfoacidibacillus ferrooxidans]|uniref:Inner membrane metabolite transport protein YgcS n=1 Tax=Sulfoacidibacillus ferrooxidans TaxID=2005001 RepID=A0A9X1VCG2_9BACL|nr:MFS transporter [Sulfoacidibacillus ferrooxidans]MCI0183502.1 Inner membrane metabolite transport protein YgcS [Sulfoacidibacillus ferrooxidans]
MEGSDRTVASGQAVDFNQIPMNRFIRRLTFLSAMGLFLDGYDLTIISVALLFVKSQFQPSPYMVGLVGSAAVVGMLLGSLIFGNLTDRFGRRTMYLLDLLFFVVFSILAACSQNMVELILFRFLLGIGLGADYPISSTLTAEFAPTRKRGVLMVTTIGFWTVGAIVSYLVSLLLLQTGPDAWRFMLASGAIPALLVMWGRRTIPESPRWLIAKGETAKGMAVADQIATDAGVRLNHQDNAGMPTQTGSGRASFARLFQKDILRMTIFASLTWFLFDVGNYATIVFTPTIFKAIKGSTITSSVLASTALQAIGLVGIAIVWLLVDRWGRKRLQVWGFLGLGIIFIVTGLLHQPSFSLFLSLFLILSIVDQGPGQLTYVYAGEVFPTTVRATGHGVATASSRVGALLGILVLPIFMAHVGLSAALIVFGILDLIGMGLTLWLAPEPKGKDLPNG